jgi:hypothetical protein
MNFTDLEDSLDTRQGCLPFLPVSVGHPLWPFDLTYVGSYWVIAVVPYLLFCFVVDHDLETCQKIFRVRTPGYSMVYPQFATLSDSSGSRYVEPGRVRM